MEAKDLRIGNLVIVDNEDYHPKLKDKPMVVNAVDRDRKSVSIEHINQRPNTYYEHYSQYLKFIKPIPLTKEWLLKLGFVLYRDVVGFGVEYYYKGVSIYIKDGEFRFYLSTNRHWVKYDSVHEIQNIYHSLGEELTIKD